MKKIFISIVMALLIVVGAFSQTRTATWEKYPRADNRYGGFLSIVEPPDADGYENAIAVVNIFRGNSTEDKVQIWVYFEVPSARFEGLTPDYYFKTYFDGKLTTSIRYYCQVANKYGVSFMIIYPQEFFNSIYTAKTLTIVLSPKEKFTFDCEGLETVFDKEAAFF